MVLRRSPTVIGMLRLRFAMPFIVRSRLSRKSRGHWGSRIVIVRREGAATEVPPSGAAVSAIACVGPTRSTNDPSALPGTKPPHSDDLKRSDPNTDAEEHPNPARPSGGPGTGGGTN